MYFGLHLLCILFTVHTQISFEFSRQNCRPVQGTFNKNIQTQILFLDTDTFSKSIQVQILVKYSQKNIQILYFVFRYKSLNRSAKLIKLFSRKYLDTDTFEILSEKKFLDIDTFEILSEKSIWIQIILRYSQKKSIQFYTLFEKSNSCPKIQF